MTETLLITGATGNVGAEIIAALRGRGHTLRAAVTNIERARAQLGDEIDYAMFDFARPETFAPAYLGVTRMFLMRPPQISDIPRYITPAIVAAKQAGIQQIVFLSLLGVEKNKVVPHAKVEAAILAAGVPYTFLRPSFFMQNLSTTHRDEIRDGSEILVPAGNGATSFIDARDIAAVAALTLTEDGHANKAYPLTGAAALTYEQVAEIMTEVLGRPIRYRNPSLLAFIARRKARGEALAFILVMCAIYTTARLGLAKYVTDDTERLLGRAPISFKQFVEDYQDTWK